MSDWFNPESKSTCNIRLDVAEPINSLIILEQGVFVPPEHFSTGMCISMSWDLMLLAFIASTSSDLLSNATECISWQILSSSYNSLLFLSQLLHVWLSDPNTSIFAMMTSSLLCATSSSHDSACQASALGSFAYNSLTLSSSLSSSSSESKRSEASSSFIAMMWSSFGFGGKEQYLSSHKRLKGVTFSLASCFILCASFYLML